MALMGICQGCRDVFDIGDNGFRWQHRAYRMCGAQVAMGRVAHHQVRCPFLHTVVEHRHDMRMLQMSNGSCLLEKVGCLLIGEPDVQDFERSVRVQIHLLSQIDLGKAASPQKTEKTIAAKLLSYTGCHLRSSR